MVSPLQPTILFLGSTGNLTYGAENGFVTDKMVRYLEGAEEYLADTEVDLETFSFAGVGGSGMIQQWCII